MEMEQLALPEQAAPGDVIINAADYPDAVVASVAIASDRRLLLGRHCAAFSRCRRRRVAAVVHPVVTRPPLSRAPGPFLDLTFLRERQNRELLLDSLKTRQRESARVDYKGPTGRPTVIILYITFFCFIFPARPAVSGKRARVGRWLRSAGKVGGRER